MPRSTHFEVLEPREYLAADLVITELMASNNSTLADGDGNFPDWIEIHNRGDAPVNLLGWSLTDNANKLDKWKFPYLDIAPGGYQVVFASGKDRSYDSYRLTTDFHATPDGTFLADLPDGTYHVRVTFGDAARVRDQVEVFVQGQSVDTVSTPAGKFVAKTYTANVDSATSSQLALRLVDRGGETGRAAIDAIIVTSSTGETVASFDFGTDASPVEPGFTQVTAASLYSPETGFGWRDAADFVLSTPDRNLRSNEPHTNFKLSSAGDHVAIVSPDGTITSQHGPDGTDFPPQRTDVSYGFPNESSTLLVDDQSFSYLVPTEAEADLGTAWTAPAFDDTGWVTTDGIGLSQGIGFGPGTSFAGLFATDVADAMRSVNSSLWIRQEFDVTDPQAVAGLTLNMQFDDGFVAFLNGVEVARAAAPDQLVWNSAATESRLQNTSISRFFVGTGADRLVAGTNVLAIAGLNRSVVDGDFLIRPQLVAAAPIDVSTAPVGFLDVPTPGSPNSLLRSAAVTFSQPSGVFVDPFTLRLAVDTPGATIHFTTDGTMPDESSPIYDENSPLSITTTTLVQAVAFAPGFAASTPSTAWYSTVDSDIGSFSSNLPVVTLDNFSNGIVPQNSFQFNAFSIYEPDSETGRTRLTGSPTLETRAGLKIRGSSTAGRPKPTFTLEARDDRDKDKNITPLGMPSNSDWILYAAYDFDRTLIHNTFIYNLSNQIGRYAVRTRFVELFQNTDGGDLSLGDYRGVYVLMEKIKLGKDRVNITPLQPGDDTEPAITGGWIIKNDRADPGDRGFVTDSRVTLRFVDPKERDVTPVQAAWVRQSFNQMYASLSDPNPDTGYAKYIDVDSWIDHHILNLLPMNVDGFRLSAYMFKDRGGKWEMGPIWDFDRTMESNDSRDDRPDVWEGPWDTTVFFSNDSRHPWWGVLADNPDYMQRYIDRWFELRKHQLSDTNIINTIDSMAAELVEAQQRNFVRWRNVRPRSSSNYQSGKLDGTWHGEIEHMKAWLIERANWIDDQFSREPKATPPSGAAPASQQVRLSVDNGTIYYTADGSDPRLPGGQVRPDAQVYNPTTTLVDATSAASYLVPTADAGESPWQSVGFDASTWNRGQAGVGFDTGVSDALIDVPDGFTVREVHSVFEVGSASTAEKALDGQDVSIETTTSDISVINFGDPDVITSSHFDTDQAFPGGGGNQFVIEATGTIAVNVEGTYTFGMDASRGGWLKIDGADVIEAYASGASDKFGTVSLTAGPHQVEYVMFENHDRAQAKFFVAPGELNAFTDDFFLVGDGAKPFVSHIETDVLAAMRSVSSSLYLRVPFVAEHVEDTQHLTLKMRYDDGFVAYLNGTEVARRNAPDQLDANSTAIERRKDIDAIAPEVIDLTAFRDLLRDGDNVLAIHGLNIAADDGDFLVAPELTMQRFGDPIRLIGTLDLTARTKVGDSWSAPSRTHYVVADSTGDVTGLAITEVHYQPTDPTDAELAIDPTLTADDFEFIELANTSDHAMDLAGVTLSDGVDFTFPAGGVLLLRPGDYVLVAQNVEAFQMRHGTGLPVAGPFSAGRLNDSGERLVLSDRFGSVIKDFAYRSKAPWPQRAAGIGSSLEVVDTRGDYNDPSNWRPSSEYEGSPGVAGRGAATDILVNEVLAHSGNADPDRIELVNTSDHGIDVSGWLLSSDPQQLDAHAIPAGTVIEAGGYVSINSDQTGLRLDGHNGGAIWLVEPTPDATPMRFVDTVAFDGSRAGQSLGRWPNADPQSVLFPMVAQTFGAANAGPVVGDVVISEVHYHPANVAAVSEHFDRGTADRFSRVEGVWTVVDGRYQVVPGAEGDTVSLMDAGKAGTRNVRISATVQLPAESTFNRNGAIVFDYHTPTDFKFASVHGAGKWRIGERTADGWKFLAEGKGAVPAETDLFISVEIRGSSVVLRSGPSVMVSYDFGEPLVSGRIGLGSKNGEAVFDDVTVESLTSSEEFEFVELFNTTASTVDLSGWQLDRGIQWTGATGTLLSPGEAVAVVRFDPGDAARSEEFRRVMDLDNTVRLVGPYTGVLSNSGETVRLLEPLAVDDPAGGSTLVDRLAYRDQAPWPITPDGGGHSLHRTAVNAFGGFVPSFRPLLPSPGSERFVLAGDLDLNGRVDANDVAGLVLALTDPAAYQARFGLSVLDGGDLNSDGDVDYDDIAGLVALLPSNTATAAASDAAGRDGATRTFGATPARHRRHTTTRQQDQDRRLAKRGHRLVRRQDAQPADNWSSLADRVFETEPAWRR